MELKLEKAAQVQGRIIRIYYTLQYYCEETAEIIVDMVLSSVSRPVVSDLLLESAIKVSLLQDSGS